MTESNPYPSTIIPNTTTTQALFAGFLGERQTPDDVHYEYVPVLGWEVIDADGVPSAQPIFASDVLARAGCYLLTDERRALFYDTGRLLTDEADAKALLKQQLLEDVAR